MANKPVEVPTEIVERPSGNLFGKTLKKLRGMRHMAVEQAKHLMLERHKIDYMNRDKYKIVEDCIVLPSGKEVTELRLYQLVDAAVITIDTEVKSELQGGIQFLREFNDGTPQSKKS